MNEETQKQANERQAAEKLAQIERRANENKKFNHEVMRAIHEQGNK